MSTPRYAFCKRCGLRTWLCADRCRHNTLATIAAGRAKRELWAAIGEFVRLHIGAVMKEAVNGSHQCR